MLGLNSLIANFMSFLPKWFVRPFAKSYVAGETMVEALDTVQQLNADGYAVTLDILGEHVGSQDAAQEVQEEYSILIKQIAERGLDSTISVKLTHLGLELEDQLGVENIMALARDGKVYNVGITIDMENSPYTTRTFELYKKALSFHDKMGCVIQAYLYRSLNDINQLESPLLNLRICKGIYIESDKIAIQNRNAINDNYMEIARNALKGDGYICFATHDLTLIDRLEALIEAENFSRDRLEFQVLYGVPMGNRLDSLKSKGYKVRIYVPFGDAWFEYSIRRLKENPKIMTYVLKNMIKS